MPTEKTANPLPTLTHIEGQVWEIRRGSHLCARLTIVDVDADLGVSVDVQPAPDCDYAQAIAFGAEPTHEQQDRLAFDPRRPNGQLRKEAIPFFCVETSRGLHKLHE